MNDTRLGIKVQGTLQIGRRLFQDSVGPPSEDALEDLRAHFWRYYEFSNTHPEYFTLLWVDPSARSQEHDQADD